jgi:hypothetical protein
MFVKSVSEECCNFVSFAIIDFVRFFRSFGPLAQISYKRAVSGLPFGATLVTAGLRERMGDAGCESQCANAMNNIATARAAHQMIEIAKSQILRVMIGGCSYCGDCNPDESAQSSQSDAVSA